MQRLINAIDKATRAGVYSLEETAGLLQAIDQVGAVVKEYNERKQAEQSRQAEARKAAEETQLKKVEEEDKGKKKN